MTGAPSIKQRDFGTALLQIPRGPTAEGSRSNDGDGFLSHDIPFKTVRSSIIINGQYPNRRVKIYFCD